jgi:hypothetical protein
LKQTRQRGFHYFPDRSAFAMPLGMSNEWNTTGAPDYTQTLRPLSCVDHLAGNSSFI